MARFYEGVLSFLLPGLGQLFQHRLLNAVVYFSAFTLALFVQSLQFLIPWLVLGSSVEAYVLSRPYSPRDKRREAVFGGVGLIGLLAWVNLLGFTAWAAPAGDSADLIELKKFDFSIRLDMRYATTNNFTKKKVYPEARCLLRRPVAMALSRVQSSLKLKELALKVYDCYRPLSIQKKFWELVPDERYVANPSKGSTHNRGAAVDVTLINSSGEELPMPSVFDDFSERAHRDYQKADQQALANRKKLEKAMIREGFVPLPTEWWHFDYKGWEQFPVEDIPFSSVP